MTGTLFRLIGTLALLAAFLYGLYLLSHLSFLESLDLPSRVERLTKRYRRWRDRNTPLGRARRRSLAEGYDEHHAERIAGTARWLAERSGLGPQTVESVAEAALYHDVGLEEHAALIAQARALTLDEHLALSAHPVVSEAEAGMRAVYPETVWWVRWHHERMDGTGYPDGLMGEEIPLPARILAIADAYEALTHARPYRAALTHEQALGELWDQAGFQFDPVLVARLAQRPSAEIAAEQEALID